MNIVHGHQIPDDIIEDCKNCDSTGWVEYEVDYFGFAMPQWGRCNAPGCRGGEITIQQEAA